ncbi:MULTISPECIES: class II aldolase/adducin family protein [unclassified Saccharopolyspora]|uniref:class II aldolase/adducin family protein n=1 Tax=Saccharopolyspora TaxID=1835 RepID=UPI00190A0022|nr:class II aldolase/adducin family protein [Saccharopolyspora sp. HNM0986]MBK0868352.1 class II aldolase/adducin family protein [Saccharopolyspora sp. HNM0986]
MNAAPQQEQQHLADTRTGLPLPGGPVFDSAQDERRDRKRRLVAAIRLFGKYEYGEGISGHLSVRDPEHPEHFWANPFGVSFQQVKVRDLVRVDAAGNVVEGMHKINPSAFVIHSKIHELCPDAVAAAHAHTESSRALGALGRLLEPLDQESAAFYQDQVLYDAYEGPSITIDQGRDIAEKLGGSRAILLRHHGLITVGASLDEAVHRFVTFDGCARVQLLAAAAGQPLPMTHEQAVSAKAGFGDSQLGWFSFQLLYDEITAEQPDMFEE